MGPPLVIFELTKTEAHPAYQSLEISNGNRQYDFLNSIVVASLEMRRPFLSQHIIRAFNFQAITCLHAYAGEYRPCAVKVGVHVPPEYYQVPSLMEDFVNEVNRHWQDLDPVVLASFVLWKLNYIHPFINGNGRTARAACYYVLCLKLGGLLAGNVTLPELLRRERARYVEALVKVDQSFVGGVVDLKPLHDLVSELLDEQLKSSSNS